MVAKLLRSARSTVGHGVRDQLGPSWSKYGQAGPTWPSWSSFRYILPSQKNTFDQLGPSWSSTLSHNIPCTPELQGEKSASQSSIRKRQIVHKMLVHNFHAT